MLNFYRRLLSFAILLIPALGFPLGLGDASLHSTLNDPLSADIEIIDLGNVPVDELRVKLADQATFKRFGLNRPFHLSRLRFSPQLDENQTPVIRITTLVPEAEPFLNFILEVTWAGGHTMKAYTLIIDPPDFRSRTAQKKKRIVPIQHPVEMSREIPLSKENAISAVAVAPTIARPLLPRPEQVASETKTQPSSVEVFAQPTTLPSPSNVTPTKSPPLPAPVVAAEKPIEKPHAVKIVEKMEPIPPMQPIKMPPLQVEARSILAPAEGGMRWVLGFSGLIGFMALGALTRRRRFQEKLNDEITHFEVKQESVIEKVVERTEAAAEIPTEIQQPKPAIENRLDPLEEAEVYVAYQRYTEAEQVIRAALKKEPNRIDLKMKLLEVAVMLGDRPLFDHWIKQLPEFDDESPYYAKYTELRHHDWRVIEREEQHTFSSEPVFAPVAEISTPLPVIEEKISPPFVEEELHDKATEDDHLLEFDAGFATELKQNQPEEPVLSEPNKKKSGSAKYQDLAGEDVVATMLDLALLYIEMGDKSGAREVLNKVLAEGDDAQRQEAMQLLQRIQE